MAILFSAVNLDLPDADSGVVTIAGLALQHPSFVTHWDNLKLDDKVNVFRGVIGQDRELVHVGDFVKLTAHHEEVWLTVASNLEVDTP
jgi:hypothetical protein